ncbi:hypothetical protein F5051DRAFT_443569 [Lentinula edodes]|nr:hypothetical protein F5051DRAFT_443569 [Lentinula edodes]
MDALVTVAQDDVQKGQQTPDSKGKHQGEVPAETEGPKKKSRKGGERQAVPAIYVSHGGRTDTGNAQYPSVASAQYPPIPNLYPPITNAQYAPIPNGQYPMVTKTQFPVVVSKQYAPGTNTVIGPLVATQRGGVGHMFMHGTGDDEVDGGGLMTTENRGAGTLVDMGAEWGGTLHEFTGNDPRFRDFDVNGQWWTEVGVHAQVSGGRVFESTGSVSTDGVMKTFKCCYSRVETVYMNVTSTLQAGGKREFNIEWNVRVHLREGQDFEKEHLFLKGYTQWLLQAGVVMSVVVVGSNGKVGVVSGV